MNKKKSFKIFAIMCIVVFLSNIPLSASSNSDLQIKCAHALNRLNLLKGYEDGSLRLENNLSRAELISMVVRMMGYDSESSSEGVVITFTDLSQNHWAYNNIRTAYRHKLIVGFPDNTFAPNMPVSNAEALAVIIRALGHWENLEGSWPNNVMLKASQLGIDKNIKLPASKKITRGELAVLIYNSLTVSLK